MVTSFPVLGKRKSFDICGAFLDGCKNKTQDAAVFYGVNESNYATWRKVRDSGRTYYYIDNSYFDETRGTYFRVTKNAIQCKAKGLSSMERLSAIFSGSPKLKPWKPEEGPGHIVVCPQSDIFMEMIAGYRGNWLKDTVAKCNLVWPNNPVVLRAWNPDKIALSKTLKQDLEEASILITHTSAAAVTAIIEGVNIVVDPMHALYEFDSTQDRLMPLGVLADNQWTLDEIRGGAAWKWLNR